MFGNLENESVRNDKKAVADATAFSRGISF